VGSDIPEPGKTFYFFKCWSQQGGIYISEKSNFSLWKEEEFLIISKALHFDLIKMRGSKKAFFRCLSTKLKKIHIKNSLIKNAVAVYFCKV
jgi:hypothetical protein